MSANQEQFNTSSLQERINQQMNLKELKREQELDFQLSFNQEQYEKEISLEKIANEIDLIAQQSDLQQDAPHPVFSSQKLPPIKTLDYLKRLKKFTDCSNVNFLLAFIYLERLKKEQNQQLLNSYTLLRLILSSCIIAIKYNNDQVQSNEHYAKIGGVKKPELSSLEKNFCQLINYNLFVSSENFLQYVDQFTY